MRVTLDLEELELVTAALNDYIANRGAGTKSTEARKLFKRLAGQAVYWRRMQEPVKAGLTINGDEYLVMLNPETDEVEVRFRGVPVMSGEWRKPWFREGIDEEPEYESIQRRNEYEGQPQPDDVTLEVLSVALRHALANR
jgi:hypothetical protein